MQVMLRHTMVRIKTGAIELDVATFSTLLPCFTQNETLTLHNIGQNGSRSRWLYNVHVSRTHYCVTFSTSSEKQDRAYFIR